jgi:hypothetical protein
MVEPIGGEIRSLTSHCISGFKNEGIPQKLHKVSVCTHNVLKLVNLVSRGSEPFSELFCNSLQNTWKHTMIEKLINMKLLKW